MSHEEEHRAGTREKLIRMANQIGTFFKSKPHDIGVAGVAEHINKFWEPRMRRQFFEIVDAGGDGLLPIVLESSASIRRPAPEEPVKTRSSSGTAAGDAASGHAASRG